MNFDKEKNRIQRQMEKDWRDEKEAFQNEEQEETDG